jgi:hypothetical protein
VIAVSGVLALAGYQLVTYGWSQLHGDNAGFFDILWPGRYTGLHPDKGSTKTVYQKLTPAQKKAAKAAGVTKNHPYVNIP